MLHWALLTDKAHTDTLYTHTDTLCINTPSTHTHFLHTHSLHTRTADINTKKGIYCVHNSPGKPREKSRQIKTYLVVIYGNAYTPCWPAAVAAAQLGFVSFHLSPQFASVCLHCCTPICLPFASLFSLPPPCPPALPHSPLPHEALSVCVCACCWCWCWCCFCVHALFTATFIQHSHKSKEISTISKVFSRDTFAVFLGVFRYFPFCTFLY